jgi:hypothetical protein
VLDREWDRVRAEQECLKDWGSLLKTWTLASQQQAARKRAHLDTMEEALREEQVTIGKLDQRTRELLEETGEAHVAANTHAEASIKVREDLTQREAAISKWEQELQGWEEDISLKLERERSVLKSLADDLRDHEASQGVEQEHLRKMREDLVTHKLSISI